MRRYSTLYHDGIITKHFDMLDAILFELMSIKTPNTDSSIGTEEIKPWFVSEQYVDPLSRSPIKCVHIANENVNEPQTTLAFEHEPAISSLFLANAFWLFDHWFVCAGKFHLQFVAYSLTDFILPYRRWGDFFELTLLVFDLVLSFDETCLFVDNESKFER